jgi:predicted ester cyclase
MQAPTSTPPNTANAAVVRAFMDQVWDAAEPAAATPFLTPDYVDHSYQPPNRDGLSAIIATLSTAFPDQKTVIEHCVAEGDVVMLKARIIGTHTGPFRTKAATGNRVDVNVVRWFRLRDGQIAEHWALLDNLALYRQIELQV